MGLKEKLDYIEKEHKEQNRGWSGDELLLRIEHEQRKEITKMLKVARTRGVSGLQDKFDPEDIAMALHRLLSGQAGRVEPLPKRFRCDPGCPGWFLEADEGFIQKCDECDRFMDDEEAAMFVCRTKKKVTRIFICEPGESFSPVLTEKDFRRPKE